MNRRVGGGGGGGEEQEVEGSAVACWQTDCQPASLLAYIYMVMVDIP